MQQNFWVTVKRLIVAVGAFALFVQIHQIPVLAVETQSEKIEAISELVAEIEYFYLHPNATDFMNNFYTRESLEILRDAFSRAQEIKVLGWETELDDAALTELYELLRSAVTNLRPLVIRRGEATAQYQNLNFRVLPETGTQVFHTLTYGTPFEILEEVQGGVVKGDDLVGNDRWFRIRHNNQSGYVHSKYVRDLPVSEERVRLLADIGRQELRIQSKIDGWRTHYSPDTQDELQDILISTRTLQIGNWQFDLDYSELNHMLQSLSYEHLNLVTLFRYNLINDIIMLKREIENNIQGSGNARMEDYTEISWENMYDALMEARTILSEGWQDNLSDEELESIYERLLSGLNGLEVISQSEQLLEDQSNDSNFNLEQILILGAFAVVGLIAIVCVIKIIKFIQDRKFNM